MVLISQMVHLVSKVESIVLSNKGEVFFNRRPRSLLAIALTQAFLTTEASSISEAWA